MLLLVSTSQPGGSRRAQEAPREPGLFRPPCTQQVPVVLLLPSIHLQQEPVVSLKIINNALIKIEMAYSLGLSSQLYFTHRLHDIAREATPQGAGSHHPHHQQICGRGPGGRRGGSQAGGRRWHRFYRLSEQFVWWKGVEGRAPAAGLPPHIIRPPSQVIGWLNPLGQFS